MDPAETSSQTLKNKRDEYVFKIRKDKANEEITAKRVKLMSKYQEGIKGENNCLENEEMMQIQQTSEYNGKDFQELTNLYFTFLNSGQLDKLLDVVKYLRIRISNQQVDLKIMDELIDTGLMPYLMKLLSVQYKDHPNLQFEVLWIISNACAGNSNQVKRFVNEELVDTLYKHIWISKPEFVELAFWAISNIAGDSDEMRNLLIDCDIVSVIPKYFKTASQYNDGVLRNISWLIANMVLAKSVRKKMLPLQEIVNNFLMTKDTDIISNACWTYANWTEVDQILDIVASDFLLKQLLNLLDQPDPKIKTPVVRSIGNIVSGKEEYSAKLIQFGIIKKLPPLLDNRKPSIRREAMWGISNILANNSNMVARILESNVPTKLIAALLNDLDDVKAEAIICFINTFTVCTWEQAQSLVEYGLFRAVHLLLQSQTPLILKRGLLLLDHMLSKGETVKEEIGERINPYLYELEKEGMIPVIESLQQHPSDEIYKEVASLIDKYLTIDTA